MEVHIRIGGYFSWKTYSLLALFSLSFFPSACLAIKLVQMFSISIWCGFNFFTLKNNTTLELSKMSSKVFGCVALSNVCLVSENSPPPPAVFSFLNALTKLYFFLAEKKGRALLIPLLCEVTFVQVRKIDVNECFRKLYCDNKTYMEIIIFFPWEKATRINCCL